mgnify:CR=1 FL=1
MSIVIRLRRWLQAALAGLALLWLADWLFPQADTLVQVLRGF